MGLCDHSLSTQDQESESLLMPLKITQVVSVASDHSGPSIHKQQPNLPATPSPPEPSRQLSGTGDTGLLPVRCGLSKTQEVHSVHFTSPSCLSVIHPAAVSGSELRAQARSGAAEFWSKCREAGCVETIFHTFTSAMNRISERIIREQASEKGKKPGGRGWPQSLLSI